eukprot:3906685-Rhodomonas_salina.1
MWLTDGNLDKRSSIKARSSSLVKRLSLVVLQNPLQAFKSSDCVSPVIMPVSKYLTEQSVLAIFAQRPADFTSGSEPASYRKCQLSLADKYR